MQHEIHGNNILSDEDVQSLGILPPTPDLLEDEGE
jgi:hypothetical protein